MKTIGEQAKVFRTTMGWSVREMAEKCGTNRQSIEGLEAAGQRIPKFIGRLAQVMGTTTDELLAGKSVDADTENGATDTLVQSESVSLETPVPTSTKFIPANIHNAVKLMGNILWQFDKNSRAAIKPLMEILVNDPDEAPDIARKIAALATDQIEVSKNADINRAMTRGRKSAVESGHAPLIWDGSQER